MLRVTKKVGLIFMRNAHQEPLVLFARALSRLAEKALAFPFSPFLGLLDEPRLTF